jgi:hypothetical protein
LKADYDRQSKESQAQEDIVVRWNVGLNVKKWHTLSVQNLIKEVTAYNSGLSSILMFSDVGLARGDVFYPEITQTHYAEERTR